MAEARGLTFEGQGVLAISIPYAGLLGWGSGDKEPCCGIPCHWQAVHCAWPYVRCTEQLMCTWANAGKHDSCTHTVADMGI